MASEIVAESGSVCLHKIEFFDPKNEGVDAFLMKCELGVGQGSDPSEAALDLIAWLDETFSELRRDVLNTLAAYAARDLKDGETCPVCGHIEGDCC